MDDDFVMAVPLDDTDMYTSGIEVVGYIDTEGSQGYRVRCDTSVPLSTALGLLELAKAHLIANSDWDSDAR